MTPRRWWMAGLALALLVAALLLRRGQPAAGPDPERPAAAVERLPIRASAPVQVPEPVAGGSREELPFGFDAIEIEKSSICRGEQTLIRIRPRHRNAGEAAWLAPVVGGTRGWQVAWQDLAAPPGRYQVPVRLISPEGARPYVEQQVSVEIRDCWPSQVMTIGDQVLPLNGGETHQLSARLLSGADLGPGAPAASYRWDFDDGKQATSTGPAVIHDFPAEEDRPAGDGAEHTYLVRARAFDASGRELAAGMKEVNQRNAFAALKRQGHRLQLKVDYTPRPIESGRGRELPFVLRNIDREETAHLDKARLRLIGCDNEEKETREIAAGTLLEGTSLPPRGLVNGRLTWPASEPEGLCFVGAWLSGTSEPGGYEVVAYLSMTVGRSPDTITVPSDRSALLDEAMRLLGHPRAITLRDIQRLEEEGKLPRGVLSQPPQARQAAALEAKQTTR